MQTLWSIFSRRIFERLLHTRLAIIFEARNLRKMQKEKEKRENFVVNFMEETHVNCFSFRMMLLEKRDERFYLITDKNEGAIMRRSACIRNIADTRMAKGITFNVGDIGIFRKVSDSFSQRK